MRRRTRIFQSWWLVVACSVAVVIALSGCGKKRIAKMGGDDEPKDQWSQGVWIYGQLCASCHGEEGQGDEENPALVGHGALSPRPVSAASNREVELNTAHDVFTYVSAAMPPMEPGSLSEHDSWAVVAYVLYLRDGERRFEPLGTAEAKGIELHAR